MREGGTRSLPLRAFVKRRNLEVQPREGLRLGRYELLVPIAQGGMAEVWIARLLGDLGFSRVVAIKTIRPEYAEDPSFRKSFLEEARIAARISHANVIELLDLGEEGPILFQVMKLIEGDSLSKLLRHYHERLDNPLESRGGLPASIVVHILLDALAGLHAAHEVTDEDGVPMQLVHRDVSPHNVLLGVDGVARISDFGVAKALGRLVDETEAGQIRGKPGYLAPEQIDRRPLDRRTDIFAAGIVLWEMLTGKRLFRSDEGKAPIADLKEGLIPDPRMYTPTLPAAVAEVLMRALRRDPSERFATAAEMSDSLETAARISGVSGSTREVADFVGKYCAHKVLEQRAMIRKAIRGGDAEARGVARSPGAADELGPHAAQSKSGADHIGAALREFAATMTPLPSLEQRSTVIANPQVGALTGRSREIIDAPQPNTELTELSGLGAPPFGRRADPSWPRPAPIARSRTRSLRAPLIIAAAAAAGIGVAAEWLMIQDRNEKPRTPTEQNREEGPSPPAGEAPNAVDVPGHARREAEVRELPLIVEEGRLGAADSAKPTRPGQLRGATSTVSAVDPPRPSPPKRPAGRAGRRGPRPKFANPYGR